MAKDTALQIKHSSQKEKKKKKKNIYIYIYLFENAIIEKFWLPNTSFMAYIVVVCMEHLELVEIVCTERSLNRSFQIMVNGEPRVTVHDVQ